MQARSSCSRSNTISYDAMQRCNELTCLRVLLLQVELCCSRALLQGLFLFARRSEGTHGRNAQLSQDAGMEDTQVLAEESSHTHARPATLLEHRHHTLHSHITHRHLISISQTRG